MRLLLPLLFVCYSAAQLPTLGPQRFQLKLTGERNGPPQGASFMSIPVVNFPDSGIRQTQSRRPFKGRPPPPPPISTMSRPTKRPRPTSTGDIAPPPLPIPLPIGQEIPQMSQISQQVPPLPPGMTIVTTATGIRPDLETGPSTPRPIATTTPNTNDTEPALYQRFIQNDDGSYYFDFKAANTIERFEQGFFKRDDMFDEPILVKTGMYSFTSPEGVPFRTDYVADERGYRPFTRQL